MPARGNLYFELLPIEVNAPSIQSALKAQLNKGVSLVDVIPAIEKGSMQAIENSLSKVLQGDIRKVEGDYLILRKRINEVSKWLEYLVAMRKEIQSIEILSSEESKEIARIEMRLQEWTKQLDPLMQATLQKRKEENQELGRILKETIDSMQEKTLTRAKKKILEHEKMGNEKYLQAREVFSRFFELLRAHADQIASFIYSKLTEWNTLVLTSGRGFLLESIPNLPCSILFSIKGDYHLIFENVGHLLGSGLDKLVFRSICLPQGEIHALIKPLIHLETPEEEASLLEQRKENQFPGMWIETEMLLKLKNKKGIVSLKERMAFEIGGERKLFLAEDYYWDGTLWEFLEYPIKYKMESARLSAKHQKEVITDLLEGLAFIHEQNMVHHDIKPDNILLDLERKESKAVLADFHLATYIGDRQRIANVGFVSRWAPPEYAKLQIQTGRSFEEEVTDHLLITTGKLDVWGMGVIFYLLIAYELPFWVQEEIDAVPPLEEKACYRAVAELRTGWLPDSLKTSLYFPLLKKMLEPDPEERCNAAQALQILKSLSS